MAAGSADRLLPKSFPPFGKMIVGIAVENWVRYLIFAGIAWLLAYVLFKKRMWSRKIIQRDPSTADMRREFGWSTLTVVIYGLVGAGTIWLAKHGWTQMYWKIDERGMPWFWSTVVLAIVVHDAYFYWTHRWMHHRRLFRWFHLVHHESTNPSPWAAYCFAPLEAVVQAGIFPFLVIVMPIHPLAMLPFMFWQITFNVVGHTGYEIHPRWLMDSWLGRFINTPTNHIQHHERHGCNYGLYFNYWDRLMNTNHPGYESRYREVTSRSATYAKPASG